MSSVAMGVAHFNPDEARFFEGFGTRVQKDGPGKTKHGVEEVSIGIASSDGTGGMTAIGYALGAAIDNVAEAVTATAELTNVEAMLLRQLAPAEIKFHWEDDELPAADRGPAVPVFGAVVVDEATAAQLETQIAEMQAQYEADLIERARIVGYYRECMAFSRDREGRPVYLLYLELKVADYPTLVSRLMDYPKNAFNVWWTPRYIELVGKQLVKTATSATAYRWSAPT